MIRSKTVHKRLGARLSTARIQPSYLKKENDLRIQNASWERDLARLQKKLRKYAGHRSVTEELIGERRNEA